MAADTGIPTNAHAALGSLVFKALSLVVFILVGCYGNFATIQLIWREPRMHVPLNILIAAVALVDLAMCVLVMPFVVISLFAEEWLFGQVSCKLHFVLMVYLAQATVLGVATIIFERYRAICCQYYPSFSRRGCALLVSLIFILPMPVSFSYYRQDMAYFPSSGMCFNTHSSRNYEEMCIFAVDTAILKVLPIGFDFFALWKMVGLLRRVRRRVRPGTLSNEEKLTANAHAHSMGTAIVFLVSYLVLDLPLYIALVVHRRSVFRGHDGISGYARATCLWLFWMECAMKPIIYALRSKHRAVGRSPRVAGWWIRTQEGRCSFGVDQGSKGAPRVSPNPPVYSVLDFSDLNVISATVEGDGREAEATGELPTTANEEYKYCRDAPTAGNEHRLTSALLRSIAHSGQRPETHADEAVDAEPVGKEPKTNGTEVMGMAERKPTEGRVRTESGTECDWCERRQIEESDSHSRSPVELEMISVAEIEECCFCEHLEEV